MKWLNPLTWSTLALQVVGGAILFIALAWFGNRWLDNYYSKAKVEAIKQAELKASALITARNLENERRRNEALTAQKAQLESNLADARSANAASAGLLDHVRTLQNGSQNDLTACRNYANSTTELFIAINEFAGKTAAEADGHALDKKACYDAWPK